MLAVETESLDFPALLERIVDASDGGRTVLDTYELTADASPLLHTVLSRIDATIEELEDLLDAQESADAEMDAEQHGTTPWVEVKRQLSL